MISEVVRREGQFGRWKPQVGIGHEAPRRFTSGYSFPLAGMEIFFILQSQRCHHTCETIAENYFIGRIVTWNRHLEYLWNKVMIYTFTNCINFFHTVPKTRNTFASSLELLKPAVGLLPIDSGVTLGLAVFWNSFQCLIHIFWNTFWSRKLYAGSGTFLGRRWGQIFKSLALFFSERVPEPEYCLRLFGVSLIASGVFSSYPFQLLKSWSLLVSYWFWSNPKPGRSCDSGITFVLFAKLPEWYQLLFHTFRNLFWPGLP